MKKKLEGQLRTALPDFSRGTLSDCELGTDFVVVIDVLRAFTTAAYAFAGGARTIFCVAEIQQALDLKDRFPDSLIMGEVNGYGIPEFDLNNSPDQIICTDLKGKTLIQRTTAGTQGLIRSTHGKTILAVSLVTARAAAEMIRRTAPQSVHFVETGVLPDGRGDEDRACADYIISLLKGTPLPTAELDARVRNSINGMRFTTEGSPDLPAVDLEWVCSVDRFDWVLSAERINDFTVQLSKKEL